MHTIWNSLAVHYNKPALLVSRNAWIFKKPEFKLNITPVFVNSANKTYKIWKSKCSKPSEEFCYCRSLRCFTVARALIVQNAFLICNKLEVLPCSNRTATLCGRVSTWSNWISYKKQFARHCNDSCNIAGAIFIRAKICLWATITVTDPNWCREYGVLTRGNRCRSLLPRTLLVSFCICGKHVVNSMTVYGATLPEAFSIG